MQLTLDDLGSPAAIRDTAYNSSIFRPIHYLGSKLRLAPAIADALDEADPSRGAVLDLFAGSGTTALALAGHRRVIASDIQEYSRVLCCALLRNSRLTNHIVAPFLNCVNETSPMTEALRNAVLPLVKFERKALAAVAHGDAEAICAVLEGGSILAAERGVASTTLPELQDCLHSVVERLSELDLSGSNVATCVRYFGGAYFSYAQATELDCLSAVAAESVPHEFAELFTAVLLSTASDTVNTVGKQFAQPIRPRSKLGVIKRHLLSKIERDRRLDVRSTYLDWLSKYARHEVPNEGHIAARADYRDALREYSGRYSVVYADPPYTRDHYSRFYHVLETLARRDNPSIARNPGSPVNELSRGLYRDDRHQSPFCIKSQAADAFRALFELASISGANLVVSYSPFVSGAHPRMMQIDALVEMAREFYPNVNLERVDGITHSKLNHSRLNLDTPEAAEVLLVCRLKQ